MNCFKCKMCGGDLNITGNEKVVECDYCGSKQTVPNADNEKKINLFNRANRLRIASEFDKAAGIYENIIAEFPDEAEAYWGLCLCNYGIEYVDDPATAKKIPTCHRASFEKMRKDENYEMALENADISARIVYEEQAKEIDRIMSEILAVSRDEQPYDIFICYKETDSYGERTPDSVLAQDMYDALTTKGYRVFFSRITLEDKLGTQYEPYIFSALNSAKMLLAVGTDYEYFNAVWVKNEWSRFIKLMAKDKTKILIPCYKDMDPYDMPDEFKGLQSQDCGKLGFMQDLSRGIDKLFGRTEQNASNNAFAQAGGSANSTDLLTAGLLKRAFMLLEQGEWKKADDLCEQTLNIDPECAESYLGKLMAELQIKKREQLADCSEPFDDKENFSNVIRYGDEKLKNEMQGYITHITERNEICRKDAIYSSAKSKMNVEIIAYYEEAITIFKTIPDWKDTDEQIKICQKKIEKIKAKKEADRLEAERKAEEERIAAEKAAKKRKKIIAITTPIVCACIAFIIVLTTVIIPNSNYNSAVTLYKNGDYNEAILAFKALDGYKDSDEQLENCYIGKYGEEKWNKVKNIKIGDTYTFGAYEQDNNTSNGKEAIEWTVLAKEGMSLLLISDKALDCQQYNTSYADVTWETCSLRKWMNGTFLNSAFSTEEQALIQSATVSADQNPNYSTIPGNSTTDKVFLLSITEAEKYFSSNSARQCKPTDYAVANGAYVNSDNGNCWWWLRSPGSRQSHAAYIRSVGSVNCSGDGVGSGDGCVRPAMWISFE